MYGIGDRNRVGILFAILMLSCDHSPAVYIATLCCKFYPFYWNSMLAVTSKRSLGKYFLLLQYLTRCPKDSISNTICYVLLFFLFWYLSTRFKCFLLDGGIDICPTQGDEGLNEVSTGLPLLVCSHISGSFLCHSLAGDGMMNSVMNLYNATDSGPPVILKVVLQQNC